MLVDLTMNLLVKYTDNEELFLYLLLLVMKINLQLQLNW